MSEVNLLEVEILQVITPEVNMPVVTMSEIQMSEVKILELRMLEVTNMSSKYVRAGSLKEYQALIPTYMGVDISWIFMYLPHRLKYKKTDKLSVLFQPLLLNIPRVHVP